jgi:hypothetical protein
MKRMPISEDSPCMHGKLNEVKEWFVETQVVALLKNGRVSQAWKGKAQDFEQIIVVLAKKMRKFIKTIKQILKIFIKIDKILVSL